MPKLGLLIGLFIYFIILACFCLFGACVRLCVFFKPDSYIKLLRGGLVCINILSSRMRSALIASRAKGPPQYGKLYAFALVPDAFGWWLVFTFQAPSIPGDSPPNFRSIYEQIVNLAKNRSRILSENKIEILDI